MNMGFTALGKLKEALTIFENLKNATDQINLCMYNIGGLEFYRY